VQTKEKHKTRLTEKYERMQFRITNETLDQKDLVCKQCGNGFEKLFELSLHLHECNGRVLRNKVNSEVTLPKLKLNLIGDRSSSRLQELASGKTQL
jgi:hypothetical protein